VYSVKQLIDITIYQIDGNNIKHKIRKWFILSYTVNTTAKVYQSAWQA